MRRPQPRRFATWKEREQFEEMERQKRLSAALAAFPKERLCRPCQDRQPHEGVCLDCRAQIEGRQ